MKTQLDDQLARILSRWVAASVRNARLVVGIALVVTVAAGAFAALELGINSDNVRLIAEDLPSRRNHEAFARLFPNLENALLVVIDAKTPELARETANALVEGIDRDPEHFAEAYMPGGGDFFEVHGLLYRSLDELDTFADQMSRLQPIIAALEQDPSVANLAALVADGLEQTTTGGARGAEPADWAMILDSVGDATVAVYAEFPLALSWEQLLLRGSAVEVDTRRIVVVHPILDFSSFLAAGRAMERIREIADDVGIDASQGVRLRITGNPALNYEEMIGLGWDLGLGGVICFFFVIGALVRALRSFRLVVAAVTTLLVGLVWTAGLAALLVGHLSLVSASFAILFIGLGVDFAIHLGMAYAANVRAGAANEAALRGAAESVGASLAICTVTTATGFFVFVPTDYLGVAELGMIAGTGMLVIFGLTMTLLPALLSAWLHVRPGEIRKELHFRTTWWRVFDRHPRVVVGAAAVLLAVGLAALPRARFDVNVVDMRDPTTESVQAFNDLLAQSGAMSPWFVNSVVESLDAVPARAAEFEALESVSHTLSLNDYVPPDQDEKLDVLEDLAFLMDAPPLAVGDAPGGTFAEQVSALRALHEVLGDPSLATSRSELQASIELLDERLAVFLDRVARDDDPAGALARLDEVLLSGFPEQIRRLKAAINTDAIDAEELPPELVARMLTTDGRARIQVFPRDDLSDEAAFTRFTDEVTHIDPQAAGVAVNLVGFGRATRASFQQALVSAVALVTVMLALLWRHPRPVSLVLAPLLLSSVLTVTMMVALDVPFSFANVVVIPLLLGIGVDSGIHLVHRAELLRESDDDLMDSTTARAVFYSAVTTTISFGTLALSSHRGVASLGVVLAIGMVLTVLANLIVLPSLIRAAGLMRGEDAADRAPPR